MKVSKLYNELGKVSGAQDVYVYDPATDDEIPVASVKVEKSERGPAFGRVVLYTEGGES